MLLSRQALPFVDRALLLINQGAVALKNFFLLVIQKPNMKSDNLHSFESFDLRIQYFKCTDPPQNGKISLLLRAPCKRTGQ